MLSIFTFSYTDFYYREQKENDRQKTKEFSSNLLNISFDNAWIYVQ